MASDTTELVKPAIEADEAGRVVYELYGLKVAKITELNGYDDKNFHILVDRDFCENTFIKEVSRDGYILKIVNTLESKDEQTFEAQAQLLMFLNENGIKCPTATPNKSNSSWTMISLETGQHIVRLLEFVPGDILFKLKSPSDDIFYQVGVLTARLDNALKNFDHPAYHKSIPWCLGEAPDIIKDLQVINQTYHPMVRDILSEFSSRVLKNQDSLAKGLIHGDINEQNLIVHDKNSMMSIIDFGDTHHCWYLFELALAMTYMIIMSGNIETGGHVLAGYLSENKMEESEFKLLKVCIMTRICQSLVFGARSSLKDPGNEYVLTTAKKGWQLLETIWKEPEEAVLQKWKTIVDHYKKKT